MKVYVVSFDSKWSGIASFTAFAVYKTEEQAAEYCKKMEEEASDCNWEYREFEVE